MFTKFIANAGQRYGSVVFWGHAGLPSYIQDIHWRASSLMELFLKLKTFEI